MNNKEIRSLNNQFESNGRVVSGYAIRFNEESVFMGFTEVIRPNAITREQIENSDIFAFYNHNSEQVLARNGKANTLKLELREDGLWYEFEAPNTSIGDELLEHIKRNEMYGTSFAFSMNPDGTGENWTKRDDGTIFREITDIFMLYEVSPVFSPAYPTTSVSARSLEMVEKLNQNDNMTEENKTLRNDENQNEDENLEPKNEEQKTGDCEETKPEDENRSDDENENQEEKPEDETKSEDEEEKPEDETKSEDEEENKQETSEKETEEKQHKNIEKTNSMEKRNFSLLKAIRTIANGQKLDEATQAVVNMGAEDLRNAGITMNGQIQIPVGDNKEERAAITVTAEGNDVVVTDFLDILAPLHDNLTLVNAGSRYLTGLVGDVQIPSMTAENVSWVGEVATAGDGAGSFDSIKLSPKRLSAVIQISKQFLVQDSLSAENLIRNELVNAIALKLQSTILGTAAGTTNQPAGLAYNVTPTEVSDFKGICAVESALEAGNFWGEKSYILSSGAKAALRSMIKGNNGTGMVMSDNEVDGVSAQVCNAVATDCYFVGDWSQLVIAQFGGIDLTVDPYTLSADGKIRLVINAFFDAKLQRAGAIKYAKVVEPEEGE